MSVLSYTGRSIVLFPVFTSIFTLIGFPCFSFVPFCLCVFVLLGFDLIFTWLLVLCSFFLQIVLRASHCFFTTAAVLHRGVIPRLLWCSGHEFILYTSLHPAVASGVCFCRTPENIHSYFYSLRCHHLRFHPDSSNRLGFQSEFQLRGQEDSGWVCDGTLLEVFDQQQFFRTTYKFHFALIHFRGSIFLFLLFDCPHSFTLKREPVLQRELCVLFILKGRAKEEQKMKLKLWWYIEYVLFAVTLHLFGFLSVHFHLHWNNTNVLSTWKMTR